MIKLNTEGLIPVITQDASTHKVLTLAYMSKESLQKTLDENQAVEFEMVDGRDGRQCAGELKIAAD